MKFLKGLLLLLSLIVCPAVIGQYRFDTWTTDNGLPQNGVRQITQTPEGYLWFTTFDGLVRFDGVRFTTFNKSNTRGIINNRFTGLFGDTDGTLYATTMEDGILTIYRDGVFMSMTSDQVPGRYIDRIEHGAGGDLRFRTEDDDRYTRSWYHLVDGKFELIEKLDKNPAALVFIGKSGTMWSIKPNGVTRTRDEQSSFIPLDLSKFDFRPSLFEDRDGDLWLGEYRIHRIRNDEVRTFDEKDGLPGSTTYHSFWQEADGSVWCASGGISSTGNGLVQVKDDQIKNWGAKDGFYNRLIQSVFHDREGTIWLATDRGLSRRRNQVIQGYSIADGLDHSEIYPLYRDRQDNIWIGSSKGLSIYRDGKFEQLHLTPPGQNTKPRNVWREGAMSVQALWQDPNGKMWVGVAGGIYLVADGKAEAFYMGSHISAIKGDSKGNVWAATSEGLLRFNDYQLTAKYSTSDGLLNEFMTFIFEDSKGTLWFGGYGGLSRFDDGRFINYTTEDGLAGNYVRTIYEDADGAFWIGTYDEGMSRLKDGQFVNYKESNGLYNSGVFAIEEDPAGYFWISSNHGIYRVKRKELNDFADGRITKITSVGYGKEDGMLSTECNGGRQPASLKDKDGKFWFPTQQGVVVVDPLAEHDNPLPPSVVVEDILVDRQPIDFRANSTIEPGQKDIEIRYTGVSLLKSDQVKFKYKLDGKDTDWVDAGTRRTAFYSNLPPGSYTFHVKAANSNGVWNEEGTAVAFELKPYFYQTRLFILLSVFGAATLLLLIWKVSVHQMEIRERKLSRLVKERTEELNKANEILQQLANSDGLTKIGNRRRFESFLADEWHRAVRFKTEISLVMIDIDHFKLYNDTYGHQAGDDCLQKVAEAFAATIKRPTDLVARFGGEEFALVLGATDAKGALRVAEQAVENVKNMLISHSGSPTSEYLTVSVGIATTLAGFDMTEVDLISIADQALYHAKENGRNRIYVHDYLTNGPVSSDILDDDHLVIG